MTRYAVIVEISCEGDSTLLGLKSFLLDKLRQSGSFVYAYEKGTLPDPHRQRRMVLDLSGIVVKSKNQDSAKLLLDREHVAVERENRAFDRGYAKALADISHPR